MRASRRQGLEVQHVIQSYLNAFALEANRPDLPAAQIFALFEPV